MRRVLINHVILLKRSHSILPSSRRYEPQLGFNKHVHAELTSLGTMLQFLRYIGIAVGAVLILVVYVLQKVLAILE
jgi:hypothetical protein